MDQIRCRCRDRFVRIFTVVFPLLLPTILQAGEPEFADLILHNGKVVFFNRTGDCDSRTENFASGS